MSKTPLSIVQALFPTLINCAHYAHSIQTRIEALEEKSGTTNIFAAALSDADLNIQNCVEVALLAHYPQVPMFGEEWKSSSNTKYLAGTEFVKECPYLVTLDPIDGTRLYLDGHALYQIILTVISKEGIEAALILYPRYKDYVFAQKGQGAKRGTIETPLDKATSWKKGESPSRVFLGAEFAHLKTGLSEHFKEIHTTTNYTKDRQMHYVSSALRHEIQGCIMGGAQIIDGAALAFVAQEMGFRVTYLDRTPFPGPLEVPDIVLPGVIVAQDERIYKILSEAIENDSAGSQ